jgi:hypothetical protein
MQMHVWVYYNRSLGQIDQSLISIHTSFTCRASTTDTKPSTHEKRLLVAEIARANRQVNNDHY